MTYHDGRATITHARMVRELRSHGCVTAGDLADFYRCHGKRPRYRASAVLRWLGY